MYTYEKKKKGPAIQRKYYDADRNIIKERPKETDELTTARQECMGRVKRQLGLTKDIHFVANHKYPWEKLKEDIEYAFSATPPVAGTQNTLEKLEKFSGKQLPLMPPFLETRDRRIEVYGRPADEEKIDGWLASVCWTKSNLFFGPIKRTDDPAKVHPGVPQFDAHMKKGRRMSIRSAHIKSAVFDQGGFRSAASSVPDYTAEDITDEELKTVLPGETVPAGTVRADLLGKIDTVADYVDDEWIPYPAPAGGSAEPDSVAKILAGGDYLRREECTFTFVLKDNSDAEIKTGVRYYGDRLYIEVTAASIVNSVEVQYRQSDFAGKNPEDKVVAFLLVGDAPVKDDDASSWRAEIPMPADCTVGNAVLIFRKPEGNEIRKELKKLFFKREAQ